MVETFPQLPPSRFSRSPAHARTQTTMHYTSGHTYMPSYGNREKESGQSLDADRQTVNQTDRQIDRDRPTDRQTHTLPG